MAASIGEGPIVVTDADADAEAGKRRSQRRQQPVSVVAPPNHQSRELSMIRIAGSNIRRWVPLSPPQSLPTRPGNCDGNIRLRRPREHPNILVVPPSRTQMTDDDSRHDGAGRPPPGAAAGGGIAASAKTGQPSEQRQRQKQKTTKTATAATAATATTATTQRRWHPTPQLIHERPIIRITSQSVQQQRLAPPAASSPPPPRPGRPNEQRQHRQNEQQPPLIVKTHQMICLE